MHFLIPDEMNFVDYNCFVISQSFRSNSNTILAEIITFLGTGGFLVPMYLLIVLLYLKKGQYHYALMISTVALSSLFLGWILKPIFRRTRPINHLVSGAGGYSFPSGHALGGFIFCGVVLFVIGRSRLSYTLKFALSLLAVLFGFSVGISRIYLHVHYATDILGSLFIGIAWMSLLHIIFRAIYTDNMYREMNERNAVYGSDYYFNN
jgi:undecaprenyl-diphosphatase